MALPVAYLRVKTQERGEGALESVSARGLRLMLPVEPEVGEVLSVTCALLPQFVLQDQFVKVAGVQVGAAPQPITEVVFEAITDDQRARLDQYLGWMKTAKTHALFRAFSEGELQRLIQRMSEEPFPEGKVIFQEGQDANALYLVLSGRVKISKMGTTLEAGSGIAKTKEEVIALLREGEIFGEMALLDDYGRAATATANRDCRVLRLQKRDFRQLIETDPVLASKLYEVFVKILCRRLRDADKRIADTFSTTAAPLTPY